MNTPQFSKITYSTAPGENATSRVIDTNVIRGFVFCTVRWDGYYRLVLVHPAHLETEGCEGVLVPSLKELNERLEFLQSMENHASQSFADLLATGNYKAPQAIQEHILEKYLSRTWEVMACLDATLTILFQFA